MVCTSHTIHYSHLSDAPQVTRKLVAIEQPHTAVGAFFCLGHSTVVILVSIAVAASSAALADKFGSFQSVGGIIGVSVSCLYVVLSHHSLLLLANVCSFLFTIAVVNIFVISASIREYIRLKNTKSLLYDPAPTSKASDISNTKPPSSLPLSTPTPTLTVRILTRAFRLIDRQYKMYPLGFLFGLGFDTSTEVALLGLAAVKASHGISTWVILVLPLVFTAGMGLVDTIDGALMGLAYTSTALAGDPEARLFYSILLTGLSIAAALAIGLMQLLQLLYNVLHPVGPFWDGMDRFTYPGHTDLFVRSGSSRGLFRHYR